MSHRLTCESWLNWLLSAGSGEEFTSKFIQSVERTLVSIGQKTEVSVALLYVGWGHAQLLAPSLRATLLVSPGAACYPFRA